MTHSLDQLDVCVRQVAEASSFSGAVRVDDRATTARWAFGLADRRWSVPFEVTTPASVASVTKGFTALAVVRLVELGTLELATRVREFLGDDLQLVDDAVTIEHLLAHRSGIGDYLDESASGDIADHVMPIAVHRLDATEHYLPILDGHPQVSVPGERFAYNNGGYVLLALVAERAAGRPFAQLVDELVCRPARLTATRFHRSDALPVGVATGYLDADGDRTNALHLPVIGSGDGGLFSTVDDLARLWSALFAGRIVTTATLAEMVRPHSVGDAGRYGLGFWLPPPDGTVQLEGYDAGVSCVSWNEPASERTCTVIGNWSEAAWPMARTLRDLLRSEV